MTRRKGQCNLNAYVIKYAFYFIIPLTIIYPVLHENNYSIHTHDYAQLCKLVRLCGEHKKMCANEVHFSMVVREY